MRSKYHVEHSARVANGEKTISLLGVTLEKNTSTPSAFYHANLTPAEFSAFWTRQSNEPEPSDIGGNAGDFRFVRFDHTAEPYVALTIPADKALDLIASGAAEEGLALQPEFAG